jgi:hypothetical protein
VSGVWSQMWEGLTLAAGGNVTGGRRAHSERGAHGTISNYFPELRERAAGVRFGSREDRLLAVAKDPGFWTEVGDDDRGVRGGGHEARRRL